MNRLRKWQKIAFINYITNFLARIEGTTINILQFRLLIHQANLIFASPQEEQRSMSLFKKNAQIQKIEIVSLLVLSGQCVKHCQKYYIVKFKKTLDQFEHIGNNCLKYWIQCMRQRHGPTFCWFQKLPKGNNSCKISNYKFIQYLIEVLQNTIHCGCANKISLAFEKSNKNEISYSTFMNTISIHNRSNKVSLIKSFSVNRSLSSVKQKDSKILSEKQEMSTTITSRRSFYSRRYLSSAAYIPLSPKKKYT